MNVYVTELSRRLAARDVEVDIYTRATSSSQPVDVPIAPGVHVRHIVSGPFEGLAKNDLPGQLCVFAREVLRTEAQFDVGHYDAVHSHYWLSGQVGALARDRWGVPLVHSMHTMAKVKNALLAEGDDPEPQLRAIGEAQVVEAADRLIASTADEAAELVELYDADPSRVVTVAPGVDLDVFTPGDQTGARRRLGLPVDAVVLLFVGRIQPLKAPDVLLRAVAELLESDPALRDRMIVAVVGGPSGSGLAEPEHLAKLAGALGIADLVNFELPAPQALLADYYRAADVTVVPSHNESFGLVAMESQACGTPVVAARVGGLRTAVRDGVSGVLIDGHNPADYATTILRLVRDDAYRGSLAAGAVRHAAEFGWPSTVDRLLEVYADL
jgi:D-inositol-3-phosphate glycosyltransferase